MRKSMIAVTLFAIFVFVNLNAGGDSAEELITKMDRSLRGTKSNVGSITMIIEKKRWKSPRTIKMKIWELNRTEKEKGKSFILITHPIEENGKAFLKIGNEMWSFFPDVNETTKIPPSMMFQSWMGSDFTNDDLVRESSIVLDYNHKILKTEDKNGLKIVTIELIPKPKAPITWAKIVADVRDIDGIPTKQDFYNSKNQLVRTMLYDDIKKMSGIVLPCKWTLIPQDKPGDKTTLILDDMKFDTDINPQIFTMSNLRKGGQ